MAENNSLFPPYDLGGHIYPATIWLSLWEAEQARGKVRDQLGILMFSDQYDASLLQVMQKLAIIPHNKWISLCNGAGWTLLSVAALSWCHGGTVEACLRAWGLLSHTEILPEHGNVAWWATSFLNKAKLPAPKLSAFLEINKSQLAVAILSAAYNDAIEIDCSLSGMNKPEQHVEQKNIF